MDLGSCPVRKKRAASEGDGVRLGEKREGFIQCFRAMIGSDHVDIINRPEGL